VPESIAPFIADHDVMVLDHHGALCLGENLWDAFYKLETLEHYAQTLLVARLLGGAQKLPGHAVEKLIGLRAFYKS
jgi:L-fuculose-phosphate aldolase